MKHSLQLKLSQHLTLTPQLQQSIRLLQLSTLELNQEIERFLQDNPLLERDEGAEEEAAPVATVTPLPTDFTSSTTTSSTTSEQKEEGPSTFMSVGWLGTDRGAGSRGRVGRPRVLLLYLST